MPEHTGSVKRRRKPLLVLRSTFVTSQAWIPGSPSASLRSAEDDETEDETGPGAPIRVDETGAAPSRINGFPEFHPRPRDRRHNAR